jgi:hypothetical protein
MRISAVEELPLRSELVEIGGLFWSTSVLKSERLGNVSNAVKDAG